MGWNPDAPTEDSSSYDGIFSYATEGHSAIIGGAAGLIGRITKGTGYEPVGVVIMLAVTATALGLEGFRKISNSKAANEVSREPWYALGAMIGMYYAPEAVTEIADMSGVNI